MNFVFFPIEDASWLFSNSPICECVLSIDRLTSTDGDLSGIGDGFVDEFGEVFGEWLISVAGLLTAVES